MSANHAKDFGQREASARETARWLRPDLHRAIDAGSAEVSVKVKDLDELLAYVEASEYREKVQFSGRRLGFVEPDVARSLLSRDRASAPVLFKRTERYSLEVFYQELPPKNPVAPAE